ncbi:L-rhamnose isomerase [Candidatus Fermentibacterales bacterium]|nr:L-rhamnose isomerase [Candidatus Fermentibacterales bacterium]
MSGVRTARAYELAREAYSALGVDTERVLARLASISLSLNCWQGDDVRGFEGGGDLSDGGLQCTGSYPGKARNAAELRSDLEKAISLIPGRHRVNLHAIYAEHEGGSPPSREGLEPRHFAGWIEWAGERGLSLDFNPTFFAHPMAASGFTLSSPDEGVRRFWVEHGRACRRIGESMGRGQGNPCVVNIWIPDGFKDEPVDRKAFRARLRASLDEILADRYDRSLLLDSLEPKLFGIGSESCVIGSFEFYLAYALETGSMICLDTGHFHPTERVSDKISSVLEFSERLLLHLSRPVRWDSDHVPVLDDELSATARELVRGGYLDRVRLALDFFDATINRVAGWVIGARAVLRALCIALLEPVETLRRLEEQGDYTRRLAMLEELKGMPHGAVWGHYCAGSGVPPGLGWMDEIAAYEATVSSEREGGR